MEFQWSQGFLDRGTINKHWGTELYMGVSISGGTPWVIHFNGIFPYKPSFFEVPPLMETPIYKKKHDDASNLEFQRKKPGCAEHD